MEIFHFWLSNAVHAMVHALATLLPHSMMLLMQLTWLRSHHHCVIDRESAPGARRPLAIHSQLDQVPVAMEENV